MVKEQSVTLTVATETLLNISLGGWQKGGDGSICLPK